MASCGAKCDELVCGLAESAKRADCVAGCPPAKPLGNQFPHFPLLSPSPHSRLSRSARKARPGAAAEPAFSSHSGGKSPLGPAPCSLTSRRLPISRPGTYVQNAGLPPGSTHHTRRRVFYRGFCPCRPVPGLPDRHTGRTGDDPAEVTTDAGRGAKSEHSVQVKLYRDRLVVPPVPSHRAAISSALRA